MIGHGKFVGLDTRARITAVIVTFNSSGDIRQLLEDLRDVASESAVRVVVVDNASQDETVRIVRAETDVILIESGANRGYPAAINLGLATEADTEFVMILNPDLRLLPGALQRLVATARSSGAGAVVPLMLEANGSVHPSLGREPSILGALGDAVLTSRVRPRPRFLSEFERSERAYSRLHEVDWATGAAILLPIKTIEDVGEWWEELFAYSEEVDYFRRIRFSGRRILFEPSAAVVHRGGGSGSSKVLVALKCVNRVRYVERYHSRMYAVAYRSILVLALAIRSRRADHRYALSIIARRSKWAGLPHPPDGASE